VRNRQSRVINKKVKDALTPEQQELHAYVKQEVDKAFGAVQKQMGDAGIDLQTINTLKLNLNNMQVIFNDLKMAVENNLVDKPNLLLLLGDLGTALYNTNTLSEYDLVSEDLERIVLGYDPSAGDDRSASVVSVGGSMISDTINDLRYDDLGPWDVNEEGDQY
jgi:hypothetical protein